MKKLLLAFLLLPFPTFAHAGHDHADGLHQTIGAIAVIISAFIIMAGIKYYAKKKQNQED